MLRGTGMFDRAVRQVIDPLLEIPARRLAASNVSANTITVIGFVFGMLACGAIAMGAYGIGLVLILLNRLADGLDGMVARQRQASDLGGFLDIVLDLLFYGGIPVSFAISDPSRLLPAIFLVYSFIGTSGSFLAFAAISARRGVTTDPDGKKSFFYSVGLMEGTETVLFFLLFCLFPMQFTPLAWTFAGLCAVTTIIRMMHGLKEFR